MAAAQQTIRRTTTASACRRGRRAHLERQSIRGWGDAPVGNDRRCPGRGLRSADLQPHDYEPAGLENLAGLHGNFCFVVSDPFTIQRNAALLDHASNVASASELTS